MDFRAIRAVRASLPPAAVVRSVRGRPRAVRDGGRGHLHFRLRLVSARQDLPLADPPVAALLEAGLHFAPRPSSSPSVRPPDALRLPAARLSLLLCLWAELCSAAATSSLVFGLCFLCYSLLI